MRALSGKYFFPNMLNSCPNGESEVEQVLIDEFKARWDVIMFAQLPDYGDSHGLGLPIEAELAAIPKRTYRSFYKPSSRALGAIYLTWEYRSNYSGE